jgi:hypothetical protein
MEVYPNPCTTGKVHISMDRSGMFQNQENWIIYISSLTGQQLCHYQGSDIVDVTALSPGVYIIRAQNKTTSQHLVSKLVIMK